MQNEVIILQWSKGIVYLESDNPVPMREFIGEITSKGYCNPIEEEKESYEVPDRTKMSICMDIAQNFGLFPVWY